MGERDVADLLKIVSKSEKKLQRRGLFGRRAESESEKAKPRGEPKDKTRAASSAAVERHENGSEADERPAAAPAAGEFSARSIEVPDSVRPDVIPPVPVNAGSQATRPAAPSPATQPLAQSQEPAQLQGQGKVQTPLPPGGFAPPAGRPPGPTAPPGIRQSAPLPHQHAPAPPREGPPGSPPPSRATNVQPPPPPQAGATQRRTPPPHWREAPKTGTPPDLLVAPGNGQAQSAPGPRAPQAGQTAGPPRDGVGPDQWQPQPSGFGNTEETRARINAPLEDKARAEPPAVPEAVSNGPDHAPANAAAPSVVKLPRDRASDFSTLPPSIANSLARLAGGSPPDESGEGGEQADGRKREKSLPDLEPGE